MKYIIILLLILFMFHISCDYPVHVNRNNILDPDGHAYAPPAPTNLTIALENNIVKISWKDNSRYEDGYIIEKAFDDSVFSEIARLPAHSTYFEDPFEEKLLMLYKIVPYRVQDDTERRNESSIVALNLGPQNVHLDFIIEEIVFLEWENPGWFTEQFKIERRRDDEDYVHIATLPATSVTFIDTLFDMGYYRYRIIAYAKNSKSDYGYSNLLEAMYWLPGPPLLEPKSYVSQNVLLHDGRVLIDDVLSSNEIYNPGTRPFSGSLSSSSSLPNRRSHKLILLDNGEVLSVGLDYGSTTLKTAIYNPISDTWSDDITLKSNQNYSFYHEIKPVLLESGEVLITGAENINFKTDSITEIFNPHTGTSRIPAATMPIGRQGHSVTNLPDGTVLIAGGRLAMGDVSNSTLLYDPFNETWTHANPMHKPRENHNTIVLKDGKIFVFGGNGPGYTKPRIVESEIFDPETGTWSKAASINNYGSHAYEVLDNGRILAMTGRYPDYTVEKYYPDTDTWSILTRSSPRLAYLNNVTITKLKNGRIFAHGRHPDGNYVSEFFRIE